MLANQLSNKGIVQGELGKEIDHRLIDKLEDEQLRQLYELKCEAEKWGQGDYDAGTSHGHREEAKASKS